MMSKPEQKNIETGLPFSWPIPVETVPADGKSGSVKLSEEQCAEIAELLGIEEITEFRLTYELKRQGRKRFRLVGRLKANVVQLCVVSLARLPEIFDEVFTIHLWPEKDVALAEQMANEEGRSIMMDGPEPFSGDVIDVGQLAYEHLASSLDPFPRSKDAQLDWSSGEAQEDEPTSKPFADLAAMMDKAGKKEQA